MNYTIYNPTTGQITGLMSGKNEEAMLQRLDDSSYVIGTYSPSTYYIDVTTKQPTLLPTKPVDRVTNYVFDWILKIWMPDRVSTIAQIKQSREAALAIIDKVNPIRYASLTPEQQQELITYRQQLLDITTQEGYPFSVVFPKPPSWL